MDRAYISEGKGAGLFKGPLLSLLFTVAFSFFSLSLSSIFIMRAENPSAWIRILGVLLPALSAFLGGIVSSRVKKRAGALTGLISGILFVALLFLLSVLLGEDSFSIGKSVVLYTALLLLSVLGGTLGAHKRGRRRRKKRRK